MAIFFDFLTRICLTTFSTSTNIQFLIFRQHGRIMHKKTTMEVILKNKMGSGYPVSASGAASGAVEVDPASGTVYSHAHKFEKINYTTPAQCDVCHG